MPKPYTWLTFSAGARSCIGKQLALTEIKIILIQMLRKFKMSMETTDLIMKMHNFSYQPQVLKTKFIKK
jgi:cytochrome P450